MRDAFAREMTLLAQERDDICLLSGDIGNRMFDKYKEVALNRFLNCGIAEANMMSVASGMALSGLRPVIYTITPFTTTRCLEQIRVGVAYHRAPVVIVGTGSGLSYAELGPTHHSLEDMAILRAIPDINIAAPADKNELIQQLRDAVDSDFPTYIRIGKKGEPDLTKDCSQVGLGKGNILREGEDLVIVGLGPILEQAILAADLVAAKGISVAVVSLGTLRPLDNELLSLLTKRFRHWITLEEHGLIGGLGSTILEWLSASDCRDIKLDRVGLPESFIHELGNQVFIREKFGIDAKGLARRIMSISSDQ